MLAPNWTVTVTKTRHDDKLALGARALKRAVRDWTLLASHNPFLAPHPGETAGLPGAFAPSSGLWVDRGDVATAVNAIFTKSRLVPMIYPGVKRTDLGNAPFFSTEQLISLLRFRG